MGRYRLTIPATLLMALSLIVCNSCHNGNRGAGNAVIDNTAIDPAEFPEPQAPAGHTLLAKATGDLDGDGKDELAIAWTGPVSDGKGAARKLILYRVGRNSWQLWHESSGPLMGSTDNGNSGDPFHSLEIEDGTILIHHIGGSREHWDYLHRYKRNGTNWELESASITYGELCDTFTTINYNLANGELNVNRESNNCDETGTEVPGKGDARMFNFVRKERRPGMDGFKPGTNRISMQDGSELFF